MDTEINPDRLSKNFYVIALAPIVIGIIILWVWYVTRITWMPFAGIALLYIAVPLNLVSLIVLISRYISKTLKTVFRDRSLKKQYLAVIFLLVLNYPVAGFCFYTGWWISNEVEIKVVNQSPVPLEEIKIIGPRNNEFAFPDVAINETTTKTFHPGGEGSVEIEFTAHQKKFRHMALGYITDGMGGSSTIVVDKEFAVTVQEKNF